MGNALYNGIIALGRAIDSIAMFGCGTGDISHTEERGKPKCAVGHVTYAIAGHPLYAADSLQDPDEYNAAQVAFIALIEVLPAETRKRLYEVARHTDEERGTGYPASGSVLRAFSGEGEMGDYQTAVIMVNDRILRGSPLRVSEWFSAAFDLLAARLPEPHYFKQLAALTAQPHIQAPL